MIDITTKAGMEMAKEWTEKFVSMLAEGGMWLVPRSEATYQIFYSKKEVIRKSSHKDEDIEMVFKAMDWSIKNE